MLNKIILIGRVGHIEQKTTTTGLNLTKIAVATNESYKDKNGQKVEETTWHNVHAYQKLGEIVTKYVKKGDLVYIEGKSSNKKMKSQQGQDITYTCVMAKEIKILNQIKDTTKDVSKSENYGNVKDEYSNDFLF